MWSIKEIVDSSGMTQSEFARHFDIPLRTLQDWYAGKHSCPEYLKKLLYKEIKSERWKKYV